MASVLLSDIYESSVAMASSYIHILTANSFNIGQGFKRAIRACRLVIVLDSCRVDLVEYRHLKRNQRCPSHVRFGFTSISEQNLSFMVKAPSSFVV